MNAADKPLCFLYGAIAVAALIATWSQNIAFFAMPDNGGFFGFLEMAYANPPAASLANDLWFLGTALCIFMVLEAKRLKIRFVWLYILLSFVIAISTMFPLYLIARQCRIAAERKAV